MTTSTASSRLVWSLRRASSADNVYSHPAFSSFVVRAAPHDWRQAVEDKLEELCALPVGWDGYAAPPVSFATGYFAMTLLASVCPADAPAPQVVPGPNGDLQLEWHTDAADVELHVKGPNDVAAWRCAPSMSGDGEETHLRTDFTIVAQWLAELAEGAVAACSSAA